MNSRWLTMLLGLAVIVGVGLMVGCEDPFHSSSSGTPAGTSTIQGNISDFGMTSTPAVAGIKAGVTITLKGTSFTATTADDGTFVISGVPAGNYILVIKYGDAEVEYVLGDVPANARVEISDLAVSAGGSVGAGSVKVIDLGTGSTTRTADEGGSSTPTVPAGMKVYNSDA
jgi:hypothetical protein